MSNLVPEGWYKSKLGLEAYLTMGQSPLSDTYNFEREGLPFFQGKTDFGTHRPKVRVWCNNPTKIAKENSILFSVRAPVGDVNITDNDCCIGRGLAGIIGKTVDQSYLYQNIQFLKKMFILLAQGSTFEAVNGSELKEFPLILPPLPEQQKIAKILTSVDDVIEKTQLQIDKLKDLKTGMMQELLTNGIGHTEFKDSPVGKIPAKWKLVSLGELGVWKGGGTPSKANKEFWSGNIPWVSPKDMKTDFISKTKDAINEDAIKCSSTNLIKSGSILIVVRSGILQHTLPLAIASNDLTINQDMKALSLSEKYYRMYIYHYIKGNNHKVLRACLKAGNTVESIDFSRFSEYKIPCPPLIEQKRIGDAVESIAINIRKKEQVLKTYKKTKKALMQDLLTGKVRVKVDSE